MRLSIRIESSYPEIHFLDYGSRRHMEDRAQHLALRVATGRASQQSTRVVVATTREGSTLLRSEGEEV